MLIVISFLAFTIGVTLGWVSAERYIAFMQHIEHDHEELFEKNPHPELFDDKGNLNRGDYMTISFDPGCMWNLRIQYCTNGTRHNRLQVGDNFLPQWGNHNR